MKSLLILLFFVLPFSMAGQCSLEDYQNLLQEARAAQKLGKYDLAINKLSSAQVCRPEKAEEVKKLILEVFDDVNQQRKIATEQTKIAQQEKEQAIIAKDKAVQAENSMAKTTVASLNASMALQLSTSHPTLALRIAWENLIKNPSIDAAADAFRQVCDQNATTYCLSVKASQLPVECVGIAADSKRFAAVTSEGKVTIWNMDGSLVFRFYTDFVPMKLRFSGNGDSIHLTGYYKQKPKSVVYSINGEKFSESAATLQSGQQKSPISYLDLNDELQFAADWRKRFNEVDSFDITRLLGHKVQWNRQGIQAVIQDAAVSSDGRLVVTGGADGTVKVWTLQSAIHGEKSFLPEATGSVLFNQFHENPSYFALRHLWKNESKWPASALAISPSERQFAVVFYELNYFSNHTSHVFICDLYASNQIASFSEDGIIYQAVFENENTLSTWNIRNRHSRWTIMGKSGTLLASDSTESRPATRFGFDSVLQKINNLDIEAFLENAPNHIQFDELLPTPLKTSNGQIRLEVDSERQVAVSNNLNGFYTTIAIQDYKEADLLYFSKNNTFFALASYKTGTKTREYSLRGQTTTDLEILLVSTKTGQSKTFSIVDQNGDYNRIKDISISDDDRYLLAVIDGDDECLIVWEIAGKKPVLKIPKYESLAAARFMHKSTNFLAIKNNVGTQAVVYNLKGNVLREIPLNNMPVTSPLFELSADGAYMLIGGLYLTSANYVDIWNVKTGAIVGRIAQPYDIECARFHPELQQVVIGTQEGKILAIDFIEKNLVQTIEAHTGQVRGLSYASGYLYSIGEDNTLKCWNAYGKQIWNRSFSHAITSIAVDEQNRFVYVNDAGAVHMLHTPQHYMQKFISAFDNQTLFEQGYQISPKEINSIAEFEMAGLDKEKERDWNAAIAFYNKALLKKENAVLKSKVYLLSEAPKIKDLNAFLDVSNEPVLIRFFADLNADVMRLENELGTRLTSLDSVGRVLLFRNKANFLPLVEAYKKVVLFSRKVKGGNLLGQEYAYYLAALVWYSILNGNIVEAEGLVIDFIQEYGDSPVLVQYLPTIYLIEGKTEQAKFYFDLYRKNTLGNPKPFYFKALVYQGFHPADQPLINGMIRAMRLFKETGALKMTTEEVETFIQYINQQNKTETYKIDINSIESGRFTITESTKSNQNSLVKTENPEISNKFSEPKNAVTANEKIEGEKFLEENKKSQNVQITASGLQYEVLKRGNGDKPGPTSKIKVHYHGTLINGTVFDSSLERREPIVFRLNQVIQGWQEALQLMPIGSKWKLYIPYNLAYGEKGLGEKIKPFSTLIFEVELLEIMSN